MHEKPGLNLLRISRRLRAIADGTWTPSPDPLAEVERSDLFQECAKRAQAEVVGEGVLKELFEED